MGYKVVEAQTEALAYLERVAARKQSLLRVGGHSKGGNLAVYASVLCKPEVQERIVDAYCNDGPGFTKDAFPQEAVNRIAGKLRIFIPEYCIVGMFFDLPGKPLVIASEEKGVMQHSDPSWEVDGNHFAYKDRISKECLPFNNVFEGWMYSVDESKREPVVSAFFDSHGSSGVRSVDDLSVASPLKLIRIVRSLEGVEDEDKAIIECLNRDDNVDGQECGKKSCRRLH